MATRFCTGCGFEMTAGRPFCPRCGKCLTQAPPAAASVSQTDAPLASPLRICSRCGSPILENKRFCSHCGNAYSAAARLAEPKAPTSPDLALSTHTVASATVAAVVPEAGEMPTVLAMSESVPAARTPEADRLATTVVTNEPVAPAIAAAPAVTTRVAAPAFPELALPAESSKNRASKEVRLIVASVLLVLVAVGGTLWLFRGRAGMTKPLAPAAAVSSAPRSPDAPASAPTKEADAPNAQIVPSDAAAKSSALKPLPAQGLGTTASPAVPAAGRLAIADVSPSPVGPRGSKLADHLQLPPTPAAVTTPAVPISSRSGTLHYTGPPVAHGGVVVFSGLPSGRLRFTFDHQAWQPLISHQPDGTQILTLRSLGHSEQTQCDVRWEVVQ